MKKTYEAPSIEKVEFQYRDQVVVASSSATRCHIDWENHGSWNDGCKTDGNYTGETGA